MRDGHTPIGRRIPHSIDAEMALLGAILVNNKAFERVADFLKPQHFMQREHARIFGACGWLIERGKVADPVTLKSWIENDDELSSAGGAGILIKLADCAVTTNVAADYGKVLLDLYQRRSLIALGENIVNRAYADDGESAEDLMASVEAELIAVETIPGEEDWSTIGEAAAKALRSCDETLRGVKKPAIQTGLIDLDSVIGGLAPGKFYVIASRPRMGKSALALNIAINAAQRGEAGAIFSLEMDDEELGLRQLSAACRIDSTQIASGRVEPDDMTQLIEEVNNLNSLPLHINDRPVMTIDQLGRLARRAKTRHKLKFIVVDYLQLVKTIGKRDYASVGEISTSLKILSRELSIAVVALSQLNRECEKRDNHRPILSDLRESGNLEQDADVIMFLNREEEYLRVQEPPRNTAKHDDWMQELDAVKNLAEIIVGKNRGGQCRIVPVQFDAKTTMFNNLSKALS